MDNNDLVSIVIPVYNGEKYLALSIESCLNQTYSNIELIIVNDCSTDNSLAIATEYQKKDDRIVIINNIKNLKLPASLNVGHIAAQGSFITWTSDDNVYNLNAIECLLGNLKKNYADLVYSDISIINIEGAVIRKVSHVNFENNLFGNFIGSCFLYKKEVFEKNNGYNEDLFLVEDYDFWLRASLHSRFYQLKKNLYNYRLHGDSLTYSIAFDENKKSLFTKNVKVMYINFVDAIMKIGGDIIVDFQTNILMHNKIEFAWLIKNKKLIFRFIKKINKYENYSDNRELRKVFRDKMVHVLVMNSEKRYNFQRALFVIINFYNVMDINTLKTLIKYSLFKK
ncbi:hypothetical protein GCM10022291_19430 [Postechiella marina]|uniref:Glycosyltransferase 2-like domain-containing protein n=1 Tax=Postechiella marina TaxID=943941 RepID=A0ABP8C9Z5_9FLAO